MDVLPLPCLQTVSHTMPPWSICPSQLSLLYGQGNNGDRPRVAPIEEVAKELDVSMDRYRTALYFLYWTRE